MEGEASWDLGPGEECLPTENYVSRFFEDRKKISRNQKLKLANEVEQYKNQTEWSQKGLTGGAGYASLIWHLAEHVKDHVNQIFLWNLLCKKHKHKNELDMILTGVKWQAVS